MLALRWALCCFLPLVPACGVVGSGSSLRELPGLPPLETPPDGEPNPLNAAGPAPDLYGRLSGSALALAAEPSLARPVAPQERQDEEYPDGPPQRERPMRFFAMFSAAGGDYDHEDDDLGSDDNQAAVVRLRFGVGSRTGRGGGVDLRLLLIEDDLYENTAIAMDSAQFDTYFYFMTHFSQGRFRMPARVGPYFNRIQTELRFTGEKTDYFSFGARFELEPEVVLMDDREFTLSVFSTLSLGLHGTWIDDDIANDDFVANGGTYGGEAGVRMQMGDIIISSALVINNTTIRESSSEKGVVIPRLDTEFLGFQVTMGIRF